MEEKKSDVFYFNYSAEIVVSIKNAPQPHPIQVENPNVGLYCHNGLK